MKASVILLIAVGYAQAAFGSCGVFEVSKGDVKVQKSTGSAVAAAVGSKICAGETVIALESSRAKIKMEDGNELNISPNSKIVIETYQYDVGVNKKKVMLNILRGKVRATTREENMYNDKANDGQANTFQIRTKSAVAGVRGTDFLTGFDPATRKTEVITFRGKVEVGLAGPGGSIVNSVFVAVGQRTVVTAGQTPDMPRALPAQDLMKQNTDTKSESAPPAPAAGAGSGASAAAPASGSAKSDSPVAGSGSPAAGAGSGRTAVGQVPSSTNERLPSSVTTSPGTLITSADLPSSPAAPVVLPVMPTAPNVPAVPSAAATNNQLINSAIQGKRNAIINISIKVRN